MIVAIAREAIETLRTVTGITRAAELFGLPRSTFYATAVPPQEQRPRGGGLQPNALSNAEQQTVLDLLHSDRFVDASPYDIHASLIDEGTYVASVRSFYRILERFGESGTRGQQAERAPRPVPTLCARQPNTVWSWDISPILTTKHSAFFQLYVVIDLYSRFVPGWRLEEREDKQLAVQLFEKACAEQQIQPNVLSVHADNGGAMRSEALAECLGVLGVTRSFSRPRVSNDNPYSESFFGTTKTSSEYPGRFATIEQARAYFGAAFASYNHSHYHSGLGFLTPASVHFGEHVKIIAERQRVLDAAYEHRPERFRNGRPKSPGPRTAWINKPATLSNDHRD